MYKCYETYKKVQVHVVDLVNIIHVRFKNFKYEEEKGI